MGEKSIIAPGGQMECVCVRCTAERVVQFLVWTESLPSRDVRNAAVETGVVRLRGEWSASERSDGRTLYYF